MNTQLAITLIGAGFILKKLSKFLSPNSMLDPRPTLWFVETMNSDNIFSILN